MINHQTVGQLLIKPAASIDLAVKTLTKEIFLIACQENDLKVTHIRGMMMIIMKASKPHFFLL